MTRHASWPVYAATMIATSRLVLVPATVALTRLEMGNRGDFARLLSADVPANWPPASAADALPLLLRRLETAPNQVGWFNWYALARISGPDLPVLVGGGGFLGPPQHGVAQIGYSVLSQFNRQGYATELVGGLVRWAFAQPGLDCIEAKTEWANPASTRVLEKAGFKPVGSAREPGGMRFELRART